MSLWPLKLLTYYPQRPVYEARCNTLACTVQCTTAAYISKFIWLLVKSLQGVLNNMASIGVDI